MLGIRGYTFVFTSIYSSYIHFGHEVGHWALGVLTLSAPSDIFVNALV